VRGGGRALALGLLAAAVAGCGYSFRGTLPEHIQTVAVPLFANKTGEPRIESLLTSAVVEAFSTNGRLRVVKREDADAVLEGEVVGYSLLSISYDSQANVRQYRLIMTINLKLLDMRRSAVLFEERNLREKADFQVMNAVSQTISVEETAGSPREYKKFIHELQAQAALADCTIFLLTGTPSSRIAVEHTMVDGVMQLQHDRGRCALGQEGRVPG